MFFVAAGSLGEEFVVFGFEDGDALAAVAVDFVISGEGEELV